MTTLPRMRIVSCTMNYPPGAMGGAEHQARLQAEKLVQLGHQVSVVCPAVLKAGRSEQNGVVVHRLRAIERRPLARATYLARLVAHLLVRARDADIVHIHEASAHAD